MTGARGRGEVAAYLLSLGGPDLYTRNAFELTGLGTNADARAIRERRQRLTTKAATGDAQAATALAGIEELRDERHRLAHEIFHTWHGERENSCGCPHSVHVTHTNAVHAHGEALRLERAGLGKSADQQWGEAADAWQNLLRHAGFWDHLRYRIDQLGDRRMNETTVAEIRDVLPTVLATPIVELAVAAKSPSRLVKRAPAWNFDTRAAADLLAEATTTLVSDIEDVLGKASDDLDADRLLKAAGALLDNAVPKARRLDQLLPQGAHRTTARTLDQVATLLNNCALAIGHQQMPPGVSVSRLFDTALALVTTPAQRTVIAENAAAEKQRRAIDADLAQFGLTVQDNGLAKLGDRLTECLRDGRLAEAKRILTMMRKHSTDPAERRQIDQLLSTVERRTLNQLLSRGTPGGRGGLGSEDEDLLALLRDAGVSPPTPQYQRTPPTRSSARRRSGAPSWLVLWLLAVGAISIVIGVKVDLWWGIGSGIVSVLIVLIVAIVASKVRK